MSAPALPTTAMPPMSTLQPLTRTRPFRWGGVFLIVAFTLIYALTLDTGLQPYELHGGDLITHQFAQVQARPGNAPGYPLYTMGGWLWFHGWRSFLNLLGQPYPNPMPILSSYSTLWALIGLWFFYQILGMLVGRLPANKMQIWQATGICTLLAGFYGTTYFFWYYATTTEQYSSAIAQTLAIFYVYLKWERDPSRSALLYLLSFLCGISLAHMLTVAFIVPPLVAVVLWRDPSLLRNARAILTAVAAAALPLTSYLYVYLRGALNPNWWGRGHWDSPQAWFWAFVSTAQGRDELSWAFEPGRPFFGNGFPEGIWQELSLPLMTLGLLGIAKLPRRHAVVIYGTLAIYLIFCWLYRFGNWFQVILPVYPLLLLGIVPLFAPLLQHKTQVAHMGRVALLASLLITLAWRANESLPAVNSRHRPQDTALDRAAILLDQPLPHDARLFATVDDALALSYLTEIWGIRPDIKPINSSDAGDDLSEGKTIFSTVDALPALLAEITVTPVLDGFSPDWIELTTETPQYAQNVVTNANSSAINYTVTPDLRLASYAERPSPMGEPLSPPVEPALDILLTWHLPDGRWPSDLAISLRPMHDGAPIVDPQSSQPLQQDRPRPLYGLWTDSPIPRSPDDPVVIHDPYRLPLLATSPATSLLLILYTQHDSGFTNIAEITLSLPAP